MSISNSSLRGKRYTSLLRVSTVLNEASIGDQKFANDKFALAHGMVHAEWPDEVLEGVSGAKTYNRRDLKRLIFQAEVKKSFDVLVVYDSSRLTRGGSTHGATIRRAFAKAGVLIQSVMDPVPEGDFKDVMQSIIDTQNNLYSKRLSAFITRGIVNAVLRGDVAHHGAIPIGIDRIYIRSNGERFLRLRYRGNNVRELWNEEKNTLIERRFDGSGTAYRKQKSERVILVPADSQTVQTIREAFALHYVENWGYAEIGLHLTRRGLMPLRGSIWGPSSVRSFLLNPLYLGWDYFLKTAAGLFYKGSSEGPVKRDDINQEALEDADISSLPILLRERTEMLLRDQPEMNEYIVDPVVRQKAELAMNRFFDTFHVRLKKPVKGELPLYLDGRKRNPQSTYLVRGIMREPTLKRTFAGRATGAGPFTRYYHLAHANAFCEKGSVGRRTIPAEPVERAVLEIIQQVFKRSGRVEALINERVSVILAERPVDVSRDALVEEVREVEARLKAIFYTSNSKNLLEMSGLIKSLQVRQDELIHQLALRPVHAINAEKTEVAAKVIDAVACLQGNMDASCYGKLRQVLQLLITDFTMNLETREGVLVMEIPDDVLMYDAHDFGQMCATFNKVHSREGCSHNSKSLKIGTFRLIPPVTAGENWPRGARYEWIEVAPTTDSTPDLRKAV